MRDYGNAILDCLSARGVWEPGESIRPGDYGQIVDACFVRLGSVADVGIHLGQPQVNTEGPYEFSRGFETQQQVSATANVEWTGEAISAIHWKGGAGLFLGSPKSQLLTISDLGQVVKETLQRKGWWKFNWRLVRQVRTVDNGVIALGGNSASSGRISLSATAPLHDGNVAAAVQRSDGFSLLRQAVNGAVYAQVVRLKPFLMHGAAPLDHSLWYEDVSDDE